MKLNLREIKPYEKKHNGVIIYLRDGNGGKYRVFIRSDRFGLLQEKIC